VQPGRDRGRSDRVGVRAPARRDHAQPERRRSAFDHVRREQAPAGPCEPPRQRDQVLARRGPGRDPARAGSVSRAPSWRRSSRSSTVSTLSRPRASAAAASASTSAASWSSAWTGRSSSIRNRASARASPWRFRRGRSYQPRDSSRSSAGMPAAARPLIASPRPPETRARISGSRKCVVASTIAFARGEGSSDL
jgi:hypothetical protein